MVFVEVVDMIQVRVQSLGSPSAIDSVRGTSNLVSIDSTKESS